MNFDKIFDLTAGVYYNFSLFFIYIWVNEVLDIVCILRHVVI